MTTRLTTNAALLLGTLGLVACGGGEGGERPMNESSSTASTAGNTTTSDPISVTNTSTTTSTDTSTDSGAGQALVPDDTGWVDGAGNSVGIQGAWYGYDDCKDSPGDCTTVTAPPMDGFPNTGGSMCASGSTAIVNTEDEFTTKWGVGIALDLNNEGGDAEKMPYNADANGVVGKFTRTPPAGTAVMLNEKPTTPFASAL